MRITGPLGGSAGRAGAWLAYAGGMSPARALLSAAVFAALLSGGASAQARPGRVIFACTMQGSGKKVEVRDLGTGLTYAFGRDLSRPELRVTRPYSGWTRTPWKGIGRAIYDALNFTNGGVRYSVYSSHDRLDLTDRHGIWVEVPGRNPVELVCRNSTVITRIQGFDRVPEDRRD